MDQRAAHADQAGALRRRDWRAARARAGAADRWRGHQDGARRRSTRAVVEKPATSGTRTTRPPRASTQSAPDDAVAGVVGALHEHVGRERLDQGERRVLVEQHHAVHRGERRRARGPAACSPATGRAGALAQPADRGIGVEPDDERVALAPGRLEQLDVARVQQVEDAVGEHDRTRPGRGARHGLGQRRGSCAALRSAHARRAPRPAPAEERLEPGRRDEGRHHDHEQHRAEHLGRQHARSGGRCRRR